MSNLRVYLLMLLLLAALMFLQYRLWFQEDGLHDMTHLKTALSWQLAENEKLKARNDELLFQIKRMEESKESVEAHARNELGMIKKDEMFYQVVR